MDTSASVESTSASIRVKNEPEIEIPDDETGSAENPDGRVARKETVLDSLKMKLLSRQNQRNHQMLSELSEETEAKAKPPATAPSPAPSSSAATMQDSTESTSACESNPTTQQEESQSSNSGGGGGSKPLASGPAAKGGSNLFRRRKVVPVAIARKIAQKDKTRPPVVPPPAFPVQQPPSPPPSETQPVVNDPILDKPLESVDANKQSVGSDVSIESAQIQSSTEKEVVEDEDLRGTEQKDEQSQQTQQRPSAATAFRRIKPKVSINIAQNRPRKSILKKSSLVSPDTQQGSNEPSKSLQDVAPPIASEERDERPASKDSENDERRMQREAQEKLDRLKAEAEEEQRRASEEQARKQREREAEELRLEEERREIRRKEEEARKLEEERQHMETRRIAEQKVIQGEEQHSSSGSNVGQDPREEATDNSQNKDDTYESQTQLMQPKSAVNVCNRRSLKIPPEVWQAQLQRMRTNNNRVNSAASVTKTAADKKEASEGLKNRQSIESTNQESVNVILPVETSNVSEKSEDNTVSHPTEIRRISRIPPDLAKKVVNCVSAAPAKLDEQSSESINQESVDVIPPGQEKETLKVSGKLEDNTVSHPINEIRRISRIPPDLARKLVNCVSAASAKPDEQREEVVERLVAEESSKQGEMDKSQETPSPGQIKTIRRISRLPPNLAMKLVNCVAASSKKAISSKEDQKEEKAPENKSVPEVPPTISANQISNDLKPTQIIPEKSEQTKEIRRISRLPPSIALKLLDSVGNKNRVSNTSSAKPKEESCEVSCSKAVDSVEESSSEVRESSENNTAIQRPSSDEKTPVNADKSIRRISHLPASIAQKLVSSLKEKDSVVSQPSSSTEEHATTVATVTSPDENKSTKSAEKSRQKVQILSQVILPSASYNLEEILAGKSSENINTIPSGNMPFPFPMPSPRMTQPAAVDATVPKVDELKTELDVDVNESEQGLDSVEVCPTADPSPNKVRNIHPENPEIEVLPDCSTRVDGMSAHTARKETKLHTVAHPILEIVPQVAHPVLEIVPQVPQIPQMPVSRPFSLNVTSSQQSYPRPNQTPMIVQQPVHISATQPNITFIASAQSQPQQPSVSVTYQQHIPSSHSVNYPNVAMYQRPQIQQQPSPQMVVNPVSLQHQHPHQHPQHHPQQHPHQHPHHHPQQHQQQLQQPHHMRPQQRHSYVPARFLLVQHLKQRHETQQQQHLLVPRPSLYHRNPASHGPNPIIVPTPRFLLTSHAMSSQQQHQQQQPQQPRLPVRYMIPTTSPTKRAFRPVETVVVSSSYAHHHQQLQHQQQQHPHQSQAQQQPQQIQAQQQRQQQQQPTRIIPKIVIDRSYVESDSPPGIQAQQNLSEDEISDPCATTMELKQFSPCSQAIKNKLREKILRKEEAGGVVRPSPTTATNHRQPKPTPSVYYVHQPRTTTALPAAPPEPPAAATVNRSVPTRTIGFYQQDADTIVSSTSRPIRQYVYGHGKKIYLTKISVVKPGRHQTDGGGQIAADDRPSSSASSNLHIVLKNPTKQFRRNDSAFYGFPQSAINSEKRDFQKFREAMKQLERNMSPEPPTGSHGDSNVEEIKEEETCKQEEADAVVTPAVATGPEGEMFIITEVKDDPAVKKESAIKQVPSTSLPKITVRRKTFVVESSDCDLGVEQLPHVGGRLPVCAVPEEEEKEEQKAEVEIKKESSREESYLSRFVKEEDELEFSESDPDQVDEDLAREILAIVQKERKELLGDESPVRNAKKIKKRRKKMKRHRKKKKDDGKEQLVNLLMKHVNQESLIADIVDTQRKKLQIIELSDTDDEVREEIVRGVKKENSEPEVTCVQREETDSTDRDGSESDIFAEILKPFTASCREEESASIELAEKQSHPQPSTIQKRDDNISSVNEAICISKNAEKPALEQAINKHRTSEEKSIISITETTNLGQETSVPICDTRALPVGEQQRFAPVAQRAPKRKLKPALVSRPKVRKFTPDNPADDGDAFGNLKSTNDGDVPNNAATEVVKMVENSCDSPSNRDESSMESKTVIAESFSENETEPVSEMVKDILDDWEIADLIAEKEPSNESKKPHVRAIVEEWDSEELCDLSHCTEGIVEETVSFESDTQPCEISTTDVVEAKATPESPFENITQESLPISPAKTPVNMVPEPSSSENVPCVDTAEKTVAVSECTASDSKVELFEELPNEAVQNTTPRKEEHLATTNDIEESPISTQNAMVTPPRATKSPSDKSQDSIKKLLNEWEDTPVKSSQRTPQKVARVLLDRIDTDKYLNAQQPESTVPPPQKSEASCTKEAIIVLQPIEVPVVQQEEPVNRNLRSASSRLSISRENIPQAIEVQDRPSVRTTRSRKLELDEVPTVEHVNNKTCKQTSIKHWLKTSTTESLSPPTPSTHETQPEKRILRNRANSILHEKSNIEEVTLEVQKPAGRTLRSRTQSVLLEESPSAKKNNTASQKKTTKKPNKTETVDQSVDKSSPQTEENQPSKTEESGVFDKVEEAGGPAGANKESSKPLRPTPLISNRIPIPISSEEEDDSSLAKRRKMFRKKRSTTRSSVVRDLNANRRLFRGAYKIPSSADNNFHDIIKIEPPEEQDSVITTLENIDEPSGRLLSIITVENNQVMHAENFDNATTPRKGYVSKCLIQQPPVDTPPPSDHRPTATSTPTVQGDHVFATPAEPVKPEKRKRRTKLEIEADRKAKLENHPVKKNPAPKPPNKRIKQEAKPTIHSNSSSLDSSAKEFCCAACMQKVPCSSWDAHYAMHSGLTYRVDIDPEIDLCDENTAAQIVMRFMKTHRQITVQCDKCSVVKKSALGLISHRMICGMTPEQIERSKVACQHCNRKLMAVSMPSHLLAHCSVLKRLKQEKQLEEAKQKAEEEALEEDGSLNQSGRVKRKATSMAERRIQSITCEDMIMRVTRADVTDGCLAVWKTQFRKAKTARCVFETCDFIGSTEAEMRHHHEFCPSSCKRFECRNCKFQAGKHELVAKHIKLKHPDALTNAFDSSGTDANIGTESSEDEGTSGVDENAVSEGNGESGLEDEPNAKKKKGKRKKSKLINVKSGKISYPARDMFTEDSDVYREMVLDEVIELRALKGEFHVMSREWTLDFRRENYTFGLLFPELRPDSDVRLFSSNMVYEYIPKRAKSVRFTMRGTNLYNAPIQVNDYTEKWQQLDAFSGQASGTDSLFFCGGPVVALDWLPLAEGQTKEHQILAVVCKNDFDEFYLADRIQPSKCLIQIWDIGYLNNNSHSKKNENYVPKLLYSIACDFGPIWTLKFCPSGCYNSTDGGDEFNRLGLLAATGSDGDVYIFSLDKNYDHLISNNHRVIHLKPVLRLTLSLMDEVSSCQYEGNSAVKLSWSKSKNHSMIAAGYSNGAVGVWNLNSKSPLLTGTKGGCRALLPVRRIFIPDSCITAVDLHHAEDSRYLLVCNADRKVLVYDLHTEYLPVEVCSVNARSKVTAACWNTHFPVIALAFDDVYAIDRCALTIHQTREIGVRLCPLYTFTAEATDMSGSDWLSNYVIGTDGGDVLCHQPIAFVHHMAQKNTHHRKYILTSTMSVQITDELTDTSYSMFENNFGLLFSDNDKNPAKMDLKSLQVKSYRRALLHEYPGIRVNQVRWNPNENSHQFYAVGYQAGFVRIRCFRLK